MDVNFATRGSSYAPSDLSGGNYSTSGGMGENTYAQNGIRDGRNTIQKSVGWAEHMNESYSETPYQGSTPDLLTENGYAMGYNDFPNQPQPPPQQEVVPQQTEMQQQQPQQQQMSSSLSDENITVSYYDQQGVMQTYTYGKGMLFYYLGRPEKSLEEIQMKFLSYLVIKESDLI